MKRKPILATVLVLFTIAVGSVDSGTDIRFFCSHNRVFIEFEENGRVWGTTWVDDEGKPQSCGKQQIITKNNVII